MRKIKTSLDCPYGTLTNYQMICNSSNWISVKCLRWSNFSLLLNCTPELTKVFELSGEVFIEAMLRDPEAKHLD
ncbi:MAG: hypothetical protein IPL83_13130 [Bdellovibrionales bacterium]|nr:hypothetical protein [Bdellovibrionales bacterium]